MNQVLQKEVRNALRSLGDIELVSLNTLAYEVETCVGFLRVVPRNGSIHCRFADPVRARKKVLCKASGVWNYLQLPNEPMKEFVAEFERSLACLKIV